MIRFRAALAAVGAACVLATGVTGAAQAGATTVPATARATAPATTGRVPGTRVAGVDVDATTVPQLERLMNRHRLRRPSSWPSTCGASGR